VKDQLGGLDRAISDVVDQEGELVVIVNPQVGDFAGDDKAIEAFLDERAGSSSRVSRGMLLSPRTAVASVIAFCERANGNATLVHAGFMAAGDLASQLSQRRLKASRHIFVEEFCGKLYQKPFSKADTRVLVRDGFKKRANRDYPEYEFFSDLHATYELEGASAFGDHLIVGDDYAESGGPAYAVAIHLTCIDPKHQNAMFVFHFKSDSSDGPTNVPGKFIQALDKLIAEADRPGTPLRQSDALDEFRELHRKSHFPGLGHVKKLSMQHHIETLIAYLSDG
jgi:hypothetical protein